MNDLEYLNQISAKPAPAKPTLFDKKTKLITIISGAVLLVAIILMIAMGSSSSSEPTEASELSRAYHHSTNLEQTITKYQPYVASSDLRSSMSSLLALLTDLKSTSSNYLTKTLGLDIKNYPITTTDSSSLQKTNTALEKARQNGILDRNVASEFHYQISRLLVIEESIRKKTRSSELESFLSSSSQSLSLLDETFSNFSDSK